MSGMNEQKGIDWETLSADITDPRVRVGVQMEFVSEAFALRQQQVLNRFLYQGITSRDDYRTLVVIQRFGVHGTSITEIAQTLQAIPGTISHRVNRLHNEGHLTRIPDARDLRSRRITLTAQGEELVVETTQAMIEVYNSFFKALDESQCETLSVLLEHCMN